MSFVVERLNVAPVASRSIAPIIAALEADMVEYYNTTTYPRVHTRDRYLRLARRIRSCLVREFLDMFQKFPVDEEHKQVQIAFGEPDSGDAEYDDQADKIVLSLEYLSRVAKELRGILQSYEDRGVDQISGIKLNSRTRTKDALTDMIAVVAHEFVHSIQFKRSAIGTSAYRSYTMPNKHRFWDHINAGNLDAHYLASPNEISAYAHQRAVTLLRQVDHSASVAKQVQQLTDLMRNADRSGTFYQDLGQFPPAVRRKIQQKFTTLVYKELSEYRDELLSRKKN